MRELVFEQHVQKSNEILADVLAGKESVTPLQARTSLAVLNGVIKERQAISGKAARVIGLVKHIRLPETREAVALAALRELVATPALASGAVEAAVPPALAPGASAS